MNYIERFKVKDNMYLIVGDPNYLKPDYDPTKAIDGYRIEDDYIDMYIAVEPEELPYENTDFGKLTIIGMATSYSDCYKIEKNDLQLTKDTLIKEGLVRLLSEDAFIDITFGLGVSGFHDEYYLNSDGEYGTFLPIKNTKGIEVGFELKLLLPNYKNVVKQCKRNFYAKHRYIM